MFRPVIWQIVFMYLSDRRYISRRKWIFYSRFTIARRRRTADRRMGVSECQWHSSCELTEPTGEKAASGLSEAILQSYIHQSSYKRQAECLSYQHWQTGAGTLWKAHWGHETGTRHNRTVKGWKRLRMGRTFRQHKSLCKGDCKQGNYFCISG